MSQDKAMLIATHNGCFHADDVFSTAVLLTLYPNAHVVRTRDPDAIHAADFAVDVGGEWAPDAGRFDHHQKGFSGRRSTGVAYASAGLVWLTHGATLVARLHPNLSAELALRVCETVDAQLVQYLDMADTGEGNAAPGDYGIAALISAFNPSRAEENTIQTGALTQEAKAESVARLKLDRFLEATQFLQRYLYRLVERYVDEFTGETLVRDSVKLAEGKILVLPEAGLSWTGVVCREMPEVLFVVYPDSSDQQFQVRTVPVEPESFTARQDFPAAWAGLRFEDLARVTGVADAVFCHNGRFIAGAISKEGALRLAERALHRA